jgi:hypothetical protein
MFMKDATANSDRCGRRNASVASHDGSPQHPVWTSFCRLTDISRRGQFGPPPQGAGVRCFLLKYSRIYRLYELSGRTEEQAIEEARNIWEAQNEAFEGFEVWNGVKKLTQYRLPPDVAPSDGPSEKLTS